MEGADRQRLGKISLPDMPPFTVDPDRPNAPRTSWAGLMDARGPRPASAILAQDWKRHHRWLYPYRPFVSQPARGAMTNVFLGRPVLSAVRRVGYRAAQRCIKAERRWRSQKGWVTVVGSRRRQTIVGRGVLDKAWRTPHGWVTYDIKVKWIIFSVMRCCWG